MVSIIQKIKLPESKLFPTVLCRGADHLLAAHPTAHLGEGRHLHVVAGEGLQAVDGDLGVSCLLGEDHIGACQRTSSWCKLYYNLPHLLSCSLVGR